MIIVATYNYYYINYTGGPHQPGVRRLARDRELMTTRAALWSVLLVCSLQSCEASTASTTAITQPAKLASGPLDVMAAAAGSYALVGSVGFAWTGAGALLRRRPVWASAAASANRWGRISAGFAGGRAAGQVLRRADDSFCALLGAVCGGVAAAATLSDAPASVATFVTMTLALELLTPKDGEQKSTGSSDKSEGRDRRMDARERARQNYQRRYANDPTRLRAIQ